MKPVTDFYSRVPETDRLSKKFGPLEFVRTQEILTRFLPPAPAVVLDVGGGDGVYAEWLASRGYEAHLIDITPEHIARAELRKGIASARVGDARRVGWGDESVDAVLFLGPMYHLVEREDRLAAWAEARRVVRAGGLVIAACINRFAPVFAAMVESHFDDADFIQMMRRSSTTGRHHNHTGDPSYFTDAYFHARGELASEAAECGLTVLADLPVEGIAWLAANFEQQWAGIGKRERLLEWIRHTEQFGDLLPASAHGMVVAKRPE